MRASKAIIFGTVLLSSIFLTSCEDAEDRAILSAQNCLNGLGDSPTTTAVDVCLNKVAGIDNEQSNIIKCSGYFIRGGLTNSKIIAAFDQYKTAAAADKEATLIDVLALDTGATPADDKLNAENAYTYCNKTNVPGLAYIASLCRIGTLVKQYGNPSDTVQVRIDALIAAGAGSDADKEVVGEMVVTLADLYCVGDAKESNICIEMASAQALATSGGVIDYADLAARLLTEFAHGT